MNRERLFGNILLLLIVNQVTNDIILNIAQGQLRGIKSDDGNYVSYNGIPYVASVRKNYRFKRASPPSSWSGIRDAKSPSSQCISAPGGILQGDEDCLYLNIHVPTKLEDEVRFPVLLWIHGGSFTAGSGSPSTYGPGKLITHRIIVASLNYRLGALGFLCLGHEKVPGNAGAKDVIMALRWIRDNIVAFSGDPSRVTIAGQGTGAAIVDALILSNMADGLFHGAIAQSGTAISPWGYNYDSGTRARNFANYISNSSDINDIAEDYLNSRATQLVRPIRKFDYSYFPFALCKEKSHKREERFLHDDPYEILKTKKIKSVPYMIGFNSNDGNIISNFIDTGNLDHDELVHLLPDDLSFFRRNQRLQYAKRIRASYFSRKIRRPELLRYFRDAYFLNHIHRNVRMHSESSDQPVYFYQFDYTDRNDGDDADELSPGYGDELKYLFTQDNDDGGNSNNAVSNLMTTLWTNFVKFGNPTPQLTGIIPEIWNPIKNGNIQLYKIGSISRMEEFKYDRQMLLWDEIYQNHYYNNYDD